MAHTADIVVRQATGNDVGGLIKLESDVYAPLGMEVYGSKYFHAWLETNPAGLLVAVQGGNIVGYKYWQSVNFSFQDLHLFRDYPSVTDGGFTRKSHIPLGNAMHGVTICSMRRGAGKALFNEAFRMAKDLEKGWYVGFTRIPGFDKTLKRLEASHQELSRNLSSEHLAAWYVLENARLAKSGVWQTFPRVVQSTLPRLTTPDPALGKQLKFSGFKLAGILSNCMLDPQSRNFAALMIRKIR